MFRNDAKITWTNDAISVLRYRDRYFQESMVRDFERTIKSEDGYVILRTQCIDPGQNFYATRVMQDAYIFFWKYFESENRIEIWAVYHKLLSSVDEVKKLIEKEGWNR